MRKHALVIRFHLSFVQTVALLAITTTALMIWVVEPSAMRLLARWQHAPALHARARLHRTESLWRIRARLEDQPGSLAAITPELAAVRATILDRQVYPPSEVPPDEIVVGAAEHVREEDLLGAIQRGGGVDVDLWRTTALDLVDGQTKALTLAARVALTHEELPVVVAKMLGAQVVTDLRLIQGGSEPGPRTDPPCRSHRHRLACSSPPAPMSRSPG